MRKVLLAGAAAAGLALSAAPAEALFVGTIPLGATNEVLSPLRVVEGWYGADIYLFGGPAQITVTLIGFEAGFTNTFRWDSTLQTLVGGGGTSGNLGAPIGTSFVVNNVPSGLLPFTFDSNSGSDVTNGANADPGLGRGNFFVTFTNSNDFNTIDQLINGSTPFGGTVAWVWYDDLGAGPDDNHDDLVIRMEITGGSFGVPEPTTLALLGAGLLGLGFAARRRRPA